MTGSGRLLSATLAAVGWLAVPAPIGAQERGGSMQMTAAEIQETPGTATAGAYQRELFAYPGGDERRDPFAPLRAGEEMGPRFTDLELSGIIFAPEIGSVAVLVDRATMRRYRVREGEWLGDARIDDIRTDEVRFTVSGFGLTRAEVLRVNREEEQDE